MHMRMFIVHGRHNNYTITYIRKYSNFLVNTIVLLFGWALTDLACCPNFIPILNIQIKECRCAI